MEKQSRFLAIVAGTNFILAAADFILGFFCSPLARWVKSAFLFSVREDAIIIVSLSSCVLGVFLFPFVLGMIKRQPISYTLDWYPNTCTFLFFFLAGCACQYFLAACF